MLRKQFNKNRTVIISLTLMAVAALAVLVGCDTVEKEPNLSADEQKELAQQKEQALSAVSKDTTISLEMPEHKPQANDSGLAAGLKEPEIDVKKFSPPKIMRDFPEGPGASADELGNYENIVKQMLNGQKNKYKWIEGKSEKLITIYKKMTFEQRRVASELPPPPPPKIEVKKFSPPKIEENKEIGMHSSSSGTNVEIVSNS